MKKNDSLNYIFGLVDSHWVCINHQEEKRVLCDFLKDHGFNYLPDWINYCLAENDLFWMKYRVFGCNIHIYLSKL